MNGQHSSSAIQPPRNSTLEAIAKIRRSICITPRRVEPYDYSFNEAELHAASESWGCNCGPAALAAILGVKLDVARVAIPNFEERRYTTPTMMQKALEALNVPFIKLEKLPPPESGLLNYGLVRVQWEGPWLNPGVPAIYAYRYTHWIAAIQGKNGRFVFDVNSGWESFRMWEASTAREIAALYKKATGKFRFTHRWNLELPEGSAAK